MSSKDDTLTNRRNVEKKTTYTQTYRHINYTIISFQLFHSICLSWLKHFEFLIKNRFIKLSFHWKKICKMKSIRKNTFQLSWIHFKSNLVRFILFCFGKTEPKTFRLSLKKKNNYRSIFKFYSLDIWARPWKWDSAIYSCYRRGTLFNSLIKILSNPPPPPQNKNPNRNLFVVVDVVITFDLRFFHFCCFTVFSFLSVILSFFFIKIKCVFLFDFQRKIHSFEGRSIVEHFPFLWISHSIHILISKPFFSCFNFQTLNNCKYSFPL